MARASPAIVSCVGYVPAAIRDLKLSTTSLLTAGIWLASETRLENESGEKLRTASSEDGTFAVEEEEVVFSKGKSGEVVTPLICIDLTPDIGFQRPLISENLEEVLNLRRFIGVRDFGILR